MKPTTSLENLVVHLSPKLPKITQEQIQFGYDNCLDETFGVRCRKTVYCLECGFSYKESAPEWHDKILSPECPFCKSKIKIIENCKSKNYMVYYGIITKHLDFQIVRMFSVNKYMEKNEKATYSCSEVMQHWINSEGIITTISKKTQSMSQAYDQWIFNSEMEIRVLSERERMRRNLSPFIIYPKRQFSKYVKRNGFKSGFYGITAQNLFSIILRDSFAETLLKANQISALKYYEDGMYKIENHWKSIKICIRNNYKISDFGIWKDYVDLLMYFKKDVLSPKYVCPIDLHKAHDRLVEKKRKIQMKQKFEELKSQITQDNVKYQEDRNDFFDLNFNYSGINISVIKNVKEVMEEGDILRHCVFTNEYYKDADCLLLSARINNTPIETIEFSLSKMKVIQSRGQKNKPSKYNKKIIKVVNDNIEKIRIIHIRRIQKQNKNHKATA